MFDFNNLIGVEVSKAKEILNSNGFDKVNIIMNAEHNDKCDTILVCAVRVADDSINLICGEFLMQLKGDDL